MKYSFLMRIVFVLILILIGTIPTFANEGYEVVPVTPWMIIPFIFLLLSIAIIPFIDRHWWEKYYPHISFVLGTITVVYYVFFLHNSGRIIHTGIEYISFIILIGSLFVVSGGIHIRIRGRSTPLSNVTLLGIGAIVSNFLGTTGASMILIRPYLRVNRYRLRPFHIVFFIFIVSNIGGALTPIGDPPLFLGYLKGVPFFWVFGAVWYIWLFVLGIILLIFFVFDYFSFWKFEHSPDRIPESELHEEAEVNGWHNVFFLLVILISVFIQKPQFIRELLMIIAAVGSYKTTKQEVHKKNDFNFIPIKEVAILFLGIFATMVPALDWLELNASKIGVNSAGQFYWGTGILSSFLDNAPTYLNYLSGAIGLFVDQDIITQVQHLIMTKGSDIGTVTGIHTEEIKNTFVTLMRYHSDLVAAGNVPLSDIQVCYLIGNHEIYLKAISVSAVFFGSCTYIGNGPNFMVKSIAEQRGVKCPSFGGYIGRYSLPILIPTFIFVWLLFFR